jgi:hypothetical protein
MSTKSNDNAAAAGQERPALRGVTCHPTTGF